MLTDVHVHMAALPTPDNGCLLSKRMRRSPLLRFISWQQDLPLDDPQTANRRYLERLEAKLAASTEVDRAVLLAIDGVYDAQGRLVNPVESVHDRIELAPRPRVQPTAYKYRANSLTVRRSLLSGVSAG